MAKRRTKKKTLNLSVKGRARIILTIILASVFGFAFFLNTTGIYTYDRLLIDVGLRDKPAKQADTEVHFVDVGQGDCTVVISNGEAMVIDSGDKDENDTAVNYLKKQGIETIKYLIVTHPHADHIGEMPEIINNFTVEKFIMPKVADDAVPTTSIYEDMLNALKNKGIKATKADDCQLTLGNCSVLLFTPKEDYDNLNNYSTMVKIVHGDNSFLITGDCEKQEEKELLEQGFDLSAKVLKAGHHGSYTSSSSEFLNEVLPRYAVISCGTGNKYGHPNEETVTRLKKYADYLFVTADEGNIVFYSSKDGLTVKTSKGE